MNPACFAASVSSPPPENALPSEPFLQRVLRSVSVSVGVNTISPCETCTCTLAIARPKVVEIAVELRSTTGICPCFLEETIRGPLLASLMMIRPAVNSTSMWHPGVSPRQVSNVPRARLWGRLYFCQSRRLRDAGRWSWFELSELAG